MPLELDRLRNSVRALTDPLAVSENDARMGAVERDLAHLPGQQERHCPRLWREVRGETTLKLLRDFITDTRELARVIAEGEDD